MCIYIDEITARMKSCTRATGVFLQAQQRKHSSP